jgi:uncharacterized protein (DUF302 family)
MMHPKGITIRHSKYTVKDSMDRLQAFLLQQGATIYTRINQQAETNRVGIELRPLEFIMFGNPKGGGQLMAHDPLVALDLPLKVIAWEDEEKKVWIAYNENGYVEDRYSFPHVESSPLVLDHVIDAALGN